MPRLSSYVVCPRCKYKIQQHKHFTEQIKQDYARAFSPWKPEDDQRLMELVAEQTPIPLICKELQRQPSAIKRRIELLSYMSPVTQEEPKKTATDSWTAQEQEDLKKLETDHADAPPRSPDAATAGQRSSSEHPTSRSKQRGQSSTRAAVDR